VYNCQEYEQFPDIDNTVSQKFGAKFTIKDLTTAKEVENWISDFAVSSKKVSNFYLPSGTSVHVKESR
jgi:hypothetical protein